MSRPRRGRAVPHKTRRRGGCSADSAPGGSRAPRALAARGAGPAAVILQRGTRLPALSSEEAPPSPHSPGLFYWAFPSDSRPSQRPRALDSSLPEPEPDPGPHSPTWEAARPSYLRCRLSAAPPRRGSPHTGKMAAAAARPVTWLPGQPGYPAGVHFPPSLVDARTPRPRKGVPNCEPRPGDPGSRPAPGRGHCAGLRVTCRPRLLSERCCPPPQAPPPERAGWTPRTWIRPLH